MFKVYNVQQFIKKTLKYVQLSRYYSIYRFELPTSVVSFFTQFFVSDCCFIFHPIVRFKTVVSFFTQSYVSRPLFHFSPKIWRRRDSNFRPPNQIHDELDHSTTVSCLICLNFPSSCPFFNFSCKNRKKAYFNPTRWQKYTTFMQLSFSLLSTS